MKWLLLAVAVWLIWTILKPRIGHGASMPVQEAARLLGVAEDADAEAVLDAHRKLIARVHPDTGGTSELAARVNEARDVLLSRIANQNK